MADAKDPAFESRVRASFAKQRAMATIGATIVRVAPGEIDLELPFREDLTQQHGFLHAGIVATLADSACGYAALSLMPAGAGVLSVEYKLNLLAPAVGQRMIARATVLRAGRTVTVCRGDVFAVSDGGEKLIAAMQATMMAVVDRSGVSD
jgi:uncharacterized protein (TIGR00369 family)